MTRFHLLPLVALLLAGCVNLAPDYRQPAPAIPPGASASVPAQDPSQLGRSDFFVDARLRATVELALAHNRDLRVSMLNVQRARAQSRIQDAARLPGLDASAGASRSNNGTSLSVGLGLSAFELDLFGRVRNLSVAALQSYFATDEGRRSAEISLVAEVANAWLMLAADLERQRLAGQTLDTRRSSLALDERRHALGAITGLALAQSQSLVDSSRLEIARYAAQVEQDRHALDLLLGMALPAELLPASEQNLADISRLVDLPAGVPAELLQRRPDVLQAEHQLRGSVAQIGVARAAFFPRISLTASAGTASRELSGLFKSGSWSFGPSASLPIFDGGANAAALDSARLDRDIALAQYDKAVQTAFREVADALSVRASLAERLDAQRALVANAERQLSLAQALHRAGSTGMLEVLDAQRSLYAAQQSLIDLRLTEQSNRLDLYKVLGGGWKA